MDKYESNDLGIQPGTLCIIIRSPNNPVNIGKIVTVVENVGPGTHVNLYNSGGEVVAVVSTQAEVSSMLDTMIPGGVNKTTGEVLQANCIDSTYLMPIEPLDDMDIEAVIAKPKDNKVLAPMDLD